MDLVMGERN